MTQQTKGNKLILALLWPIAGLVSSLKHWREPWAKDVFWLVCIFLGAIQIYHPAGTILGDGSDAGRYVLELEWMHQSGLIWETLAASFFTGDGHASVDIFQPVLSFLVSRVTDNGHIFFCVLAMIYGFFYSRNIWYVLDRLPDKRMGWIWVMMAFYFLVCPIWQINGVRMWTALHIFVYGAMPYLIEGKRKSLIWCVVSLLVHFSFLYPLAVIILFHLVKNRNMSIFFAFYIFTLFVKTLDLSAISSLLTNILPGMYENRIESYVNENTMDKRLEAAEKLSWHVTFANNMLYWVIQFLIIYVYGKLKAYAKFDLDVNNLFKFALLIYGVSNILTFIPSGVRFITVSQMFMIPVFMFVLTRYPRSNEYNFIEPIWGIFMLFVVIFNIRKGLGYYDFNLLTNILVAPIMRIDVPIMDMIKSFL
ncbi:EpsG family protein [Parabacteroides johnsonii]|jgi:membrane protein|uniref:EpsG family protein n=1 Tax=Parabacteroides johnsonii TaxID=387661 RepID=UPI0011DCFC84|nr:EpsG family protein [Parabacteroides johnsonii]MCS3050336.1 EpsG family protein [Parabacteroides johnsonii]